MSYIASPVSRNQLRELAAKIRRIIGYENKRCFPIIKFLEYCMDKIFEGFCFEYVEDNELLGLEGLTLPKEKLIKIPESIYYKAVMGDGRARFAITHEVAHYFLHPDGSVILAKANTPIPSYKNPEWQANTLASEILLPPNLTKNLDMIEIAATFDVSLTAAKYHVIQKERRD